MTQLGEDKKFTGYYDPLTVADRMWWARAHYQDDHNQPADLADFMARAAETLQRCVPKWWRNLAAFQAVLLLICAYLLKQAGW